MHEIIAHLRLNDRDPGYQWLDVQDRCFQMYRYHPDVIALSNTCKSLRALLFDQVQLSVVRLKDSRRDEKRTLKVIKKEKRCYVRCAPWAIRLHVEIG